MIIQNKTSLTWISSVYGLSHLNTISNLLLLTGTYACMQNHAAHVARSVIHYTITQIWCVGRFRYLIVSGWFLNICVSSSSHKHNCAEQKNKTKNATNCRHQLVINSLQSIDEELEACSGSTKAGVKYYHFVTRPELIIFHLLWFLFLIFC